MFSVFRSGTSARRNKYCKCDFILGTVLLSHKGLGHLWSKICLFVFHWKWHVQLLTCYLCKLVIFKSDTCYSMCVDVCTVGVKCNIFNLRLSRMRPHLDKSWRSQWSCRSTARWALDLSGSYWWRRHLMPQCYRWRLGCWDLKRRTDVKRNTGCKQVRKVIDHPGADTMCSSY